MKAGALLILISAMTARAQIIECRAIGKDVHSNNAKERCYEAETSFVLDIESETFEYRSFNFITDGKFCGWPSYGDFYEGRIKRIQDQSYQITQSEIVGVLTLQGHVLTYSGPENEFQLNCVTKNEREKL